MAFLGTANDIGANVPENTSTVGGLAMSIVCTSIYTLVTLNVAERAKVVGVNAAIALGAILMALNIVAGYDSIFIFTRCLLIVIFL